MLLVLVKFTKPLFPKILHIGLYFTCVKCTDSDDNTFKLSNKVAVPRIGDYTQGLSISPDSPWKPRGFASPGGRPLCDDNSQTKSTTHSGKLPRNKNSDKKKIEN